jgi:hypothetical protein
LIISKTIILIEKVLWPIDPFLGNDCETGNSITAVPRQQILNNQELSYNNGGSAENGVFYSVRAKELYNEDTTVDGKITRNFQTAKPLPHRNQGRGI